MCSVPPDDVVCRFVRQQDWSKKFRRPKQKAFNQNNPSVWHCCRIQSSGYTLEDLQIEHLHASGQIHHKVRDYLLAADEVASETGHVCDLRVIWRPEDAFVSGLWRRWNYAHAQVEMLDGRQKLPPPLRWKLCIWGTKIEPQE